MNRGFSLYLDLLRFGAAMVVLLSHFAYPRFTEGRYLWVRELNLGSDAVVVFFVLSGLVVAFSARTKDATLGRFAFMRASRIYSVALPALLIGFLLDRTGAALFPAAYEGWFYAPQSLWQTLFSGLTFSNEWAGSELRLGTNGPYWSLSYEVAYYALFALAFYLKGPRRVVALVLLALAVGPNVLLLMPCWLLGVWLWNRIARGALPDAPLARACLVLPVVGYVLALSTGLPGFLRELEAEVIGWPGVYALRYSDEVLWNLLLALGVALHLLGAAALFRSAGSEARTRAIRWLAGGSFSLYLMHYPLLQFLGTALPAFEVPVLDDALLFGLTCLGCMLFAAIFERSLPWQRQALMRSGLSVGKPQAAS